MKKLQVKYGPKYNQQEVTVGLPGIQAEAPLKPAMARQAARIACGRGYGATVVDTEAGVGYVLYSLARNSHRKFTIECREKKRIL